MTKTWYDHYIFWMKNDLVIEEQIIAKHNEWLQLSTYFLYTPYLYVLQRSLQTKDLIGRLITSL